MIIGLSVSFAWLVCFNCFIYKFFYPRLITEIKPVFRLTNDVCNAFPGRHVVLLLLCGDVLTVFA